MGNTADQGNAVHDGDAAARPPQIPGLHPETQELITARYGRPPVQYGPPASRYGRSPATRYSATAFVIGWLVAYGTLVVLSLAYGFYWSGMSLEIPSSGLLSGTAPSSVMLLAYIPLFEVFPALFIGVPAGLGVVFALRNVRNQWLHVLGFAVAGFLTPAPIVLLAAAGGGGDVLATLLLFGGAGALCAVVGRLAIWKLVEVTTPVDPAP